MSLPDVASYMLYRLTWNAERNKYDKKPCRLDGSSLGENEAVPKARRQDITVPAGCALGLWLTADLKLFFIDLDECVTNGQLSEDAARIAGPFVAAGCFFEASSSGRGAHIIGTYTGDLPAHCNRRPAVHKYEFYTRDRGVALNLDASQGNAAVDATGLLLPVLADSFPPRAAVNVLQAVGERRPEWRGPEDDEELLRRALASRGSAATIFGHKASFADLWNGKVEQTSENDMALASHLAFWTGCDVDRIERLMRRSGLMRAKWNDHRTYLKDITITQACATTLNVYQEPVRKDTAAVLVGTLDTDWNTVVETVISKINNAGTYGELMDNVVPTIAPMGIPTIRAERIVTALKKRLELFDSKPPVSQLRQLICPPVAMVDPASGRPEWIGVFCYVKRLDKFYNTITGGEYTADSFRMEYARMMPFKGNGTREDAVAWARDRWNVTTVDDVWYRPDQPVFFEYSGLQFVNKFLPTSLPTLAQPSEHCIAAIQGFQTHLYLLCGKRDDVYIKVIQWLAHNVQKPGHKIRWSPIVKGIPGDGKSIVGDLMRACMGASNVKLTSINNLTNSGGFTDWATGKALNFIEEIRIEGRDKHKLFNAMKIFVGDTIIDLNRKGRASGDSIVNITNHWANTNYGDALPIDDGERRWMVIFSPYSDISEVVAERGVADAEKLTEYFKWMGSSMRAEPGAWRAWMMGVDTSSFNPDGRAPDTPEKSSMKVMSANTFDQTVMDLLEQGGHGYTKDAFCSASLAGRVQIETQERPAHNSWNHLLVRLGYQQLPTPVWWSGKSRRIWVKKTMTAEKVREILDKTSL